MSGPSEFKHCFNYFTNISSPVHFIAFTACPAWYRPNVWKESNGNLRIWIHPRRWDIPDHDLGTVFRAVIEQTDKGTSICFDIPKLFSGEFYITKFIKPSNQTVYYELSYVVPRNNYNIYSALEFYCMNHELIHILQKIKGRHCDQRFTFDQIMKFLGFTNKSHIRVKEVINGIVLYVECTSEEDTVFKFIIFKVHGIGSVIYEITDLIPSDINLFIDMLRSSPIIVRYKDSNTVASPWNDYKLPIGKFTDVCRK